MKAVPVAYFELSRELKLAVKGNIVVECDNAIAWNNNVSSEGPVGT